MRDDTTNDVTETETSGDRLTVRRTFDASQERVFLAYVDPDQLEQWFAPEGHTMEVQALEPEPGGELLLSFVDRQDRTEINGTYLEVVENERIVHTWNYPGEEESCVTIEFRDVPGGTEVALTHQYIGPYRDLGPEENVDGYLKGWTSALERLEQVVGHR